MFSFYIQVEVWQQASTLGFYQYGFVANETMYRWVRYVTVMNAAWALFEWDPEARLRGQRIPESNDIVAEGTYMMCALNGEDIRVGLTFETALPRVPTISNSETRGAHYRKRCRERDPCCLITLMELTPGFYQRFTAAHIWPCSQDIEWNRRGFASLITDTAPLKEIGGPTKIDSIQNVILLRSDLALAFDDYCFGINPDDGYKVYPFIKGFADIAGKVLKLDHITNPNERPLDDLLGAHFLQGILRHVKGAAEPIWDYEDTFGEGAFDLSCEDVWTTPQGRAHLEAALRDRLFERAMET